MLLWAAEARKIKESYIPEQAQLDCKIALRRFFHQSISPNVAPDFT